MGLFTNAKIVEALRTFSHTILTYIWLGRTELNTRLRAARQHDRTSNRHALLLAWLPPTVKGGVYRPTSFLKYGNKLGWRMSAISGPAPRDISEAGRYLLGTIPEAVQIHCLDPPKLRPSWRFSPRIDGGFLNALAITRLAFRIFRGAGPSVVIASGPPFHNFVAAYYIARMYRTKLVLDYRDEWSECPLEFVERGNVDRIWEGRCLREAHAVIFTTRSQLEHHLTTFGSLDKDKYHVIPNGWEPSEVSVEIDHGEKGKAKTDKIVLSFVGTMFGSYQNPDRFLDSLTRLIDRRPDLRDRLILQFVGEIQPDIEPVLEGFRYSKIIKTTGLVPKPKALKFMRESDGLLVFVEPRSTRYLPGKLYDYIAAGPPVLVYGHAGEARKLVERLGVGVFVPADDTGALEKALDQICASINTFPNRSAKTSEWRQQHTRETLARRFFDILEGL